MAFCMVAGDKSSDRGLNYQFAIHRRMRILATIHPPEVTRKILEYLGLSSRAPPVATAGSIHSPNGTGSKYILLKSDAPFVCFDLCHRQAIPAIVHLDSACSAGRST